MSVRGVWVMRPAAAGGEVSTKKGKVIFSRRYPTVERRARALLFLPLPPDADLCEAVFLNCSEPSEEFSEERDSCLRPFQKPVFELLEGRLWPVVAIEKNELLFVSAPLVEAVGKERPPVIELPGVVAALALLEGMSQVVGEADAKELEEGRPLFVELFQYLCLAAPFGSPVDTSTSNSRLLLQAKGNPPPPKQKQPSWRPVGYRGSSRLQLYIKEEIQAMQYDKPDVSDAWQVCGTVQAKAELEGHPDIVLTLATAAGSPPIDHLVLHPCVQSADAELATPDGSDKSNRKIRFSAPLELFVLCHYQASQVPFLPVRGFYQMKGESTLKLLVQLKLNETVKNSFDYFEVHIPFFNRGPIDKVDSIIPVTASTALSLSQDRKTVVWDIGQRFPSKSLEVSLQATVHFPEHPPPPDGADGSLEDGPYFVGATSYIELLFKIPDFTISTCMVDPRSITLFPSSKYKLVINRELSCSKYRIWNSHGNVLATFSQIKTPLK